MLTLQNIEYSTRQRPLFDKGDTSSFTDAWWNLMSIPPSSEYFVTIDGSTQLARVHLNHTSPQAEYIDFDPDKEQRELCEIVFIEVHNSHRGTGIGTKTLELLSQTFPNTRFYAFSENADDFWRKQDWTQHVRTDPKERWPHYRPLFLQP